MIQKRFKQGLRQMHRHPTVQYHDINYESDASTQLQSVPVTNRELVPVEVIFRRFHDSEFLPRGVFRSGQLPFM